MKISFLTYTISFNIIQAITFQNDHLNFLRWQPSLPTGLWWLILAPVRWFAQFCFYQNDCKGCRIDGLGHFPFGFWASDSGGIKGRYGGICSPSRRLSPTCPPSEEKNSQNQPSLSFWGDFCPLRNAFCPSMPPPTHTHTHNLVPPLATGKYP